MTVWYKMNSKMSTNWNIIKLCVYLYVTIHYTPREWNSVIFNLHRRLHICWFSNDAMTSKGYVCVKVRGGGINELVCGIGFHNLIFRAWLWTSLLCVYTILPKFRMSFSVALCLAFVPDNICSDFLNIHFHVCCLFSAIKGLNMLCMKMMHIQY